MAVTDGDWFQCLAEMAREEGVEEANFWQPKPWKSDRKVGCGRAPGPCECRSRNDD